MAISTSSSCSIQALAKKHEAKEDALIEKLDEADEKDAQKIKAELKTLQADTAMKFLELIETHAKDPAIFPAVEFLLEREGRAWRWCRTTRPS